MKTTLHLKTLLLMAVCSWCTMAAWSQTPTERMLELINYRGNYFPTLMCLENESQAESYISDIPRFSKTSLSETLEYVRKEHADAQAILQAREDILGKKLVRRLDRKPRQKHLDQQDEILRKRFKDEGRLKEAFARAKVTDQLCQRIEAAISQELAIRKPKTMPAGTLRGFEYSSGNGFAGFHQEIFLGEKDGRNVLRVETRHMRREPEVAPEPVYDVVVADTVFIRVRDMVEWGQLYDVGDRYQPDVMIFDASNWSMFIRLDGGDISSSGYATGPDHHDTLSQIVRYLIGLYNELKPKTKSTE